MPAKSSSETGFPSGGSAGQAGRGEAFRGKPLPLVDCPAPPERELTQLPAWPCKPTSLPQPPPVIHFIQPPAQLPLAGYCRSSAWPLHRPQFLQPQRKGLSGSPRTGPVPEVSGLGEWPNKLPRFGFLEPDRPVQVIVPNNLPCGLRPDYITGLSFLPNNRSLTMPSHRLAGRLVITRRGLGL